MASINIRTEESTKIEADELFNKLGLNMSTAINMFLIKAINVQGLPFDVKLDTPNKETLQAIEEGDKIAKDKTKRGYRDIKSLKDALEVWNLK